MIKRSFAILLSGALLLAASGIRPVQAQAENNVQPAEQTRAKVQKIGVGKDARAEVRLRDNSRLKGYISAAGEDSFTITDRKTGAARTVAYADVAGVNKQGGGPSKLTWIIIGAAAVTAVIVGVTVAASCSAVDTGLIADTTVRRP